MTEELTDDELMFSNFCYFCGVKITMSYVGVLFDTDPNSHPKPQILNIDGTQHLCAAHQAVKYYYKSEDFN